MSKNSTFKFLRDFYWKPYGGSRSIIRSMYFWVAVVITALSFSIWNKAGWWDDVISFSANLLSFSLAAYAMILAFGNESFLRLLSKPSEDGNYTLKKISAVFFHFIFVQTIGILLAFIAKARIVSSLPEEWLQTACAIFPEIETLRPIIGTLFWGAAYLCFVYAVCLALAAAISVSRMTQWYAQFLTKIPQKKKNSKPEIHKLKSLQSISERYEHLKAKSDK